MARQLHVRIEDPLYNEMNEYSKLNNYNIQEMVVQSIIMFLSNSNKTENPVPNFTFIDLFAGIGGMRIAFEKCGGRCVFHLSGTSILRRHI